MKNQAASQSVDDHQQQPQQQKPNLTCPRCDSTNTKFCYYNNYRLTQPRYYCKACRRYWTHGGILRNVPVGGGCHKRNNNKRSKTSSSASSGETSQTTAPPAPMVTSSSNSAATCTPAII